MTVTALTADQLADRGLAYKNLGAYEKTKGWLDQSFTWVIPTAGNFVHWDVIDAWGMIDMPMNQAHTDRLRTRNMEVGEAYNLLFKIATNEKACREHYSAEYTGLIQSTRFVFTTEHDNVLPSNTITGLMAAIYTCPDCGEEITDIEEWMCRYGHHGYDAVSGLYFTKDVPPRPMAYGNPANGPDDFRCQPVADAAKEKKTIECNGIGMGCAVWRKGLFAMVSEPWFATIGRDNMAGTGGATQDLHFCKKAKAEAGARFGVCCAVKVGHIQLRTGTQF